MPLLVSYRACCENMNFVLLWFCLHVGTFSCKDTAMLLKDGYSEEKNELIMLVDHNIYDKHTEHCVWVQEARQAFLCFQILVLCRHLLEKVIPSTKAGICWCCPASTSSRWCDDSHILLKKWNIDSKQFFGYIFVRNNELFFISAGKSNDKCNSRPWNYILYIMCSLHIICLWHNC